MKEENGSITLDEMIEISLDAVDSQVSEEVIKMNPEYTSSFAEMSLNGVDYQIQLTLTPLKENFIQEQKVRVRLDEDNLPTVEYLLRK